MSDFGADFLIEGPIAKMTLRKAGLLADGKKPDHETVSAEMREAIAACRASGVDDTEIERLIRLNLRVYNIMDKTAPVAEWMAMP